MRRLRILLAVALLLGVSVLPPFQGRAAAVGLTLDRQVSAHQTSVATTVTSPVFTTAQPNELLVAFVGADGPATANSQSFSSVTGAGLTWTLRKRTNVRAGTSEIWTAVAPTILTNVVVKGTHTGSYVGSITVAAFIGADTTAQGAVSGANAATGAPTTSLTTTRSGSWVWGVGNDWDNATVRTVGAGQTKADEYLASVGDTFWVQRQTNATANAGTVVAINDIAPTSDRWNLSAIEVLPASAPIPDTTPPVVTLTSPTDGMTVSGTNVSVAADASDNVGVLGVQFAVDGVNVGAEDTTAPYVTVWNSTAATNGSHTVTATARDSANTTVAAVTVVADNQVVAPPSGPPVLDPSTPAAMPVINNVPSVTSPSFSPPANSVVYAVFSMDSAALSNTTVSSVSNSGTPLTWRLLGREYHNNMYVGGFVEVWWAYNPTAQAGITTTGVFSQPTKNVPAPVGDFQVMVMNNAAPDQTGAAWAANYTLSGDNHPIATVTTTAANSQVYAVFNNWNTSEAPTPAAGQSITSMVLNPTDVDGYWVQGQNSATALPSAVQMSANLVKTNEWHGIAWEVLAAR